MTSSPQSSSPVTETLQRAADYLYEETTKLDAPISMTACLVLAKHVLSLAQPAPEAIQEVAANAIRAFCQNLGANTIVVTGGVERIYYSGLSLDALAVAVALALSSPHHEASK